MLCLNIANFHEEMSDIKHLKDVYHPIVYYINMHLKEKKVSFIIQPLEEII